MQRSTEQNLVNSFSCACEGNININNYHLSMSHEWALCDIFVLYCTQRPSPQSLNPGSSRLLHHTDDIPSHRIPSDLVDLHLIAVGN